MWDLRGVREQVVGDVSESGRLFVRNLPFSTNEDEVARYFGRWGEVADVRPSRIPSLCTRSTCAGIDWCCCHRAVCMAWPR